MKILKVELGARTYPIYIGSGLINNQSILSPHIKGGQVLVVTNETVAPLYLDKIKRLLELYQVSIEILPDGEEYKTLDVLNRIFDRLICDRHNRNTTLIALGGGVVGDMTGFAAACYQRGVAFIQVPTTLLSQVDSSVGGKTGVNHPLGKNMIGAFHQPSCVLIDVSTLLSLPDREYRAGLAEVIKYGLINDPAFFVWLEKNIELLLSRDADVLVCAIEKSCANKSSIVAEDETEQGVRAWLNLGHTFGHAIESFEHYKGFLHGEAVAIGTVIASELSFQMDMLSAVDLGRIISLFLRAGLPVSPPDKMSSVSFIDFMQRDKKILNGAFRLILLRAIGEAFIHEEQSIERIVMAIEASRTRCRCLLDESV